MAMMAGESILFKSRDSIIMIDIDDVHPESSKDGSDCGGDLDRGALGLLETFLKRYSNVKVTLFVTPCHLILPPAPGVERLHGIARFLLGGIADNIIYRFFIKTREPSRYDIEKNEAFNLYLTSLAKTGQIEIGIHGCSHFHNIPPYPSEFKYLDEREARRRIRIAINKLTRARIPFVKGFAPPGWGVSGSLLKALAKEGFIYIAGSADFTSPVTYNVTSMEAGLKGVPLIFPSLVSTKLVNIPRNWTPHRNSLARALKIIQLGGLLGVHMYVENVYHRVYLGNGITAENLNKLEKLVDTIKSIYGNSVSFLTFSEVAINFIHNTKKTLI
jgi:peptidoglycan/xylan/chitin deacetylase (PgdA/CDA1 family)